jgi:hypothetical protein
MLSVLQSGPDVGKAEAKADITEVLKAYYNSMTSSADDREDSNSEMWRREAIRFDPAVITALNQLWIACDVDFSGDIDIDEFKCMFRVMYEVLHEEVVDDSNGRRVDALAEEEFKKDCGAGATTLDKPRFKQSWFQLADTWSSCGAAAAEYAFFLQKITHPLRNAALRPQQAAAAAAAAAGQSAAAAAAASAEQARRAVWDITHGARADAAKQARRAADAAQATVRLALWSVVNCTKRALGLPSFSVKRKDSVGCVKCNEAFAQLAVWSREIHHADSNMVPDVDFEHCRACLTRQRLTAAKSGEGWLQPMPHKPAKERLDEGLRRELLLAPPAPPARAHEPSPPPPHVHASAPAPAAPAPAAPGYYRSAALSAAGGSAGPAGHDRGHGLGCNGNVGQQQGQGKVSATARAEAAAGGASGASGAGGTGGGGCTTADTAASGCAIDDSQEVDMGSFPLVPIGQLAGLSTPLLERCIKELAELRASITTADARPVGTATALPPPSKPSKPAAERHAKSKSPRVAAHQLKDQLQDSDSEGRTQTQSTTTALPVLVHEGKIVLPPRWQSSATCTISPARRAARDARRAAARTKLPQCNTVTSTKLPQWNTSTTATTRAAATATSATAATDGLELPRVRVHHHGVTDGATSSRGAHQLLCTLEETGVELHGSTVLLSSGLRWLVAPESESESSRTPVAA